MKKNIKWLEYLGEKVTTRVGVNGRIVQIDYDTISILTDAGNVIPVNKEDIIL